MTTLTAQPPALNPAPTQDWMSPARRAQAEWSALSLRKRLRVLRRLRHAIATHGPEFSRSIPVPGRTAADSLAAEVLPLADAIRFLERYGETILRPRRWGWWSRPTWLAGTNLGVVREPWGVVLIIAPSNYPLLLPGVQAIQALAAGNAVAIKPARGCSDPMRLLRDHAIQDGLDPALFVLLDEDAHQVNVALEASVDKVVFTGSMRTGLKIAEAAARHLVPTTMELSGSDAVFVRTDANLTMVAQALAFGLRFNSSRTCVAPRRAFVPVQLKTPLERILAEQVSGMRIDAPFPGLQQLLEEAISEGAQCLVGEPYSTQGPWIMTDATPTMRLLHEDVFAPVLSIIPVHDDDEALRLNQLCPYALGATIFGNDRAARNMAAHVDAGVVVINDMILPHADPRLPFGGRKHSGFGTTRGPEGLLEMTRVKAVSRRGGRFRPHFDPPHPADQRLFENYLLAAHAPSLPARVRAAFGVVRALVARARK